MPSYSPPWAQHVVGDYPERVIDPETGLGEPQLIKMRCNTCGETSQYSCTSGAVRQWIGKFAFVHLHRDPLNPTIPRP